MPGGAALDFGLLISGGLEHLYMPAITISLGGSKCSSDQKHRKSAAHPNLKIMFLLEWVNCFSGRERILSCYPATSYNCSASFYDPRKSKEILKGNLSKSLLSLCAYASCIYPMRVSKVLQHFEKWSNQSWRYG